MMLGKLQKLQRKRLTSFMLYVWFMTKDYLHMVTFYSLSSPHISPSLRATKKRYFHLERKQDQQFSHFVKEWYCHSSTYAPSTWKLNTSRNSFTHFKECKDGLINGNIGNKIHYWIYIKEIRTVCSYFFFPFRLYKLLIFWEKIRTSSETRIHWETNTEC